jgi:Xaa-Pro aminopeptidase
VKLRIASFALAHSRRPSVPRPRLPADDAGSGGFKARREKFMSQLPPKSVAILRSAPMRTMSNDVEYLYRQDSDFYYLTGIAQENVTAVIRPDAADGKKYVLFLAPRDARRESWEGARVGPDEAVAAFGADAAFPVADFDSKMSVFDRNTYKSTGYIARPNGSTSAKAETRGWAWRALTAERARAARRRWWTRAHPRDAADQDAEDQRFLRRAAEMSAQGTSRDAGRRARQVGIRSAAGAGRHCYANGARRMAYPSIAAPAPTPASSTTTRAAGR